MGRNKEITIARKEAEKWQDGWQKLEENKGSVTQAIKRARAVAALKNKKFTTVGVHWIIEMQRAQATKNNANGAKGNGTV